MWWIPVFLKKIVSHKNLQAQITKWKCKAQVFNHLQVKHNLCLQYSCLILKAPRWIGQWMMACTIDVSSGSYSVNILDCELAMLPESKRCKKVIVWRGYFGMDQYVSWCLPMEDLCLDKICTKYEDFCKPQANELRAIFDLLTSFRQGNQSVDEWYNPVQAQVSLTKYPSDTASILHRDIFWFFLKDKILFPRPQWLQCWFTV